MTIIVFTYLISSIVIYTYLNKLNTNLVRKIYGITIFTILFIFSFISNNSILVSISKAISTNYIYEYVHSALNNSDYIYSYLVIVSVITTIQIAVSISIKAQLISFKYQKGSSIVFVNHKGTKYEIETKEEDKKLFLNKVYIGLCKMLN